MSKWANVVNWMLGTRATQELKKVKNRADQAKGRFETAHNEATDALHKLAESDDPLEALVRALRNPNRGDFHGSRHN